MQDKLFLPGHPHAEARARQRRARARAVGARRVRLLGLPRARPGAAAAVVELPRAGRRRHRRRHVRPLALRARRAVRLRARRVRARRDPPPASATTSRATPTRRPPRTPPTRCSSSTDGVIAQLNSSWCVRVDRGELFELQVDGTEGTRGRRPARVPAAAGRRHAARGLEPGPAGSRSTTARRGCRCRRDEPDNAFKVQWEHFLRHVALDEPFPWDFHAARARRAARPSSACSRGASGGGSRCRSCDGDAARAALPRAGARSSRTRPASRARSRRRARPPRSRVAFAAAHVVADPLGEPGARRLGRDARLPAPPVGARPRRRRGDGHRAARHGARLAGGARADPPVGGRGAAAGWRAAPAPTTWRRRGSREVRAAYEEQCEFVEGAGAQVDRDGQPRAGRGRARRRTTTARSTASCSAGSSGRRSCTGSATCSTRRSPDTGARDDLDEAAEVFLDIVARERRQGRRRQGLAARRAAARSRCGGGCRRACGSTPATTSTTRS